MTTSSGNSAAVPAARARRGRRLWGVIAASVVGTSLEWYDFFLYGTAAALVFGKLFFPTTNPAIGTLAALATFAIGNIGRPIGAASIGVAAPILLLVLRLLQGLAVSGESGGATTLSLEHAPENRRAFYASWVN